MFDATNTSECAQISTKDFLIARYEAEIFEYISICRSLLTSFKAHERVAHLSGALAARIRASLDAGFPPEFFPISPALGALCVLYLGLVQVVRSIFHTVCMCVVYVVRELG
jgi:hypothetical protein